MELKQKKQEKAKKLRGDHCHSIGVTSPIRKNHSCIASTFPSNRILSVARETVCINDIARLESVLTIGSLISLSN
ncbi:hypothetical protein PGT21_030328 [Puccinia graminis f. sp. tritici]|uniref:Uncharacterized protein n=1 Tax=Puccinia graminis f. sp. tritici TaxID=56615 RepID=A0A5B0QCS6_PUCGR|nr:hypothetical protein PGT21_030328 [Puccinia graminis f. sp. tritici]